MDDPDNAEEGLPYITNSRPLIEQTGGSRVQSGMSAWRVSCQKSHSRVPDATGINTSKVRDPGSQQAGNWIDLHPDTTHQNAGTGRQQIGPEAYGAQA